MVKEMDLINEYKKRLELLDKKMLEKNKKMHKITKRDKETTMIPLTFDSMFKSLFIKNKKYLKDFLLDVLHKDLEGKDIEINILNNEAVKDNYDEYQKIVDIFLKLNDDILLNIEVSRTKYKYRKLRNDRYIGKLMDTQIHSESDYINLFYKKIIQLNINALEKNKLCSEREIVQYDKVTKEIICENPKVYIKYIENYRDLYYNGDRRRETIWFAFLASRTYSEAYTILLDLYDVKKAQSLMEEVIKLNNNNSLLSEWEEERYAAYEKLYEMKDIEKESHDEGLQEGIEQKSNEVIINMLKENTDINFISKVTNKPIEEIKKIASNLNLN